MLTTPAEKPLLKRREKARAVQGKARCESHYAVVAWRRGRKVCAQGTDLLPFCSVHFILVCPTGLPV